MPPLIVIPKEHRHHLARLTPEDVERLRQLPSAAAPGKSQSHEGVSAVSESSQSHGPGKKTSKRKYIDRSGQWPPVGTQLAGTFGGETFRAQVIAAPKLKSKKALRLLSPPLNGTVCQSFSKAQDVVTLAHRQKIGVKGKTGLTPAWDWWNPIAVSTP